MATPDKPIPPGLEDFAAACEHHRECLATYGDEDPRTVEALLVVMCLAPDDLFALLEEMSRSSIH